MVERSPDGLAIVDGERRLSNAAWYGEIGRVTGGLAALGLGRRDRLALTEVAVISATLSGSRRLALPPRAAAAFNWPS